MADEQTLETGGPAAEPQAPEKPNNEISDRIVQETREAFERLSPLKMANEGKESGASTTPPASKEPEGAAPTKSGAIDQQLRDIAKTAFHLTDEDINEFGSVRALERHLMALDAGRSQPQTQPQTTAQAQAAAVEAARKYLTVNLPVAEKDDDDGYDKNLVAAINEALKGIQDAHYDKVGEIEKSYQQTASTMTERLRSVEQRFYAAEFDRRLATLPESVRDVVGEGPTRFDASGRPLHGERAKLHDAMIGVMLAAQLGGRPMPGDEEIWKLAVQQAFGDRTAETARKEFQARMKQRSNGFIHRPAGSSTRPETRLTPAQERASEAASVAEFMRDRGMMQ